MLQIIIGNPDLKVTEVTSQHGIKNLIGRSVRLDVKATDSTGKIYNIEVQRADKGAGAKRARYNSALIDANVLLASEDTETLPETYVIFITENDVLGGKKAVYHIDRTVKETKKLFNDEAHIIYVNGKYRGKTPVGKLMHDFNCSNPDDMKIKVLAERARYFKQDDKGVRHMCKAMEKLMQEAKAEGIAEGKAKGIAEGKAKGIAKGIAEGKEEIIIEMVKNGLALDMIAKISKLPVKKIKEISKRIITPA